MKVQLSSQQTDQLQKLLHVFLSENEKINLSALRTEEACWTGNILDSLSFLALLEPEGALPIPQKIIDIGTGGGFPLLPLSLLLPSVQCYGLDAIKKKIDAIKRITDSLQIPNVHLVTERAEVIGQKKEHRDQYDIVTSRAVASLATLLEYCVPLAKKDGHIVLWKSLHIDEELQASKAAQKELHVTLTQKYEYDLGGDWGIRQLLVFQKNEVTPKQYPRAVGEAKKSPIV